MKNHSFGSNIFVSVTLVVPYILWYFLVKRQSVVVSTNHFTTGVGKPSTVQKILTGVFSNTVWDLSLVRNCGPLIMGPSRTYLSNIFAAI